ncbi:hypothetical protein COCNU_11G000200 [Cocos nucifera]|uniref:C2H2-type domain-containing protein n=1 Tax=Cocos nucifera TaxID=13894 RepID=A0A8K0INE4_COCNU|nr:hypothetical protein COCNU_11G000200 [Cocos nucifera]
MAEVDMTRGRDGVWSARTEQRVAVLWDLDNKPPRGPPYEAAVALRRVGELFGRVVDISAYANRHAFAHLPQWVLAQRRERRRLDALERKGLAVTDEPYVCGVCGRRCRTRPDLKKHFRQLHERERQKKIARMRSLKGKKRQRYRERFIAGNRKYEEAARELLTPKTGYGLASELRRAGVLVRTVEDKPQAADSALKRQMQHSVARGIDWLLLVSDDSDFSEMVRRARDSDLRTVVVGDGRKALGRHADLWVPWARVENGQVGEEVLRSWQRKTGFSTIDDYDDDHEDDYGYKYDYEEEEEEREKGFYSPASFYEEDGDSGGLDEVVDGIVVDNSGIGGVGISAFLEEEAWSGKIVGEEFGDDNFRIMEPSVPGEDLVWDSVEEEDGG